MLDSAQAAPPVREVEVVNFPDPQNVAGEVEVTNLPEVQDVNVVNGAPSSCEVRRVQLVGFTSTAYTGNLGGVLGSTQKCQLDFPGSRMCTQAEIQQTTDLPDSIADLAWMEPLSPSCQATLIIDGQEKANILWSCDELDVPCRRPDQALGQSFESTGSSSILRLSCSVEQPIACCAPTP